MKRSLLLTLLLLLTLTVTVSADVLWEPYDNLYYQSHYDAMDSYIGQIYVVPEGMTVNLYRDPKNGGLITTMEAGTRVYAGPSMTINGEVWAAGYILGDFTEGWFRLGRMQKEYSHEDFMDDYAADIEGSSEQIPVTELNGTVFTWTWPGSGHSDGTRTFDGSASDYNDGYLSFLFVYTDPNGGRWGYIGYYMGHCGWAYLDDLTNPEPPLRLDLQSENTVTDTASSEQDPGFPLVWVLLPVVLLVAGTVVLIVVLKKKHRA